MYANSINAAYSFRYDLAAYNKILPIITIIKSTRIKKRQLLCQLSYKRERARYDLNVQQIVSFNKLLYPSSKVELIGYDPMSSPCKGGVLPIKTKAPNNNLKMRCFSRALPTELRTLFLTSGGTRTRAPSLPANRSKVAVRIFATITRSPNNNQSIFYNAHAVEHTCQ